MDFLREMALLLVAQFYRLLYTFEGTYTQAILVAGWDILRQLWYYVILGIFVTTLVSLYLPRQRLTSLLNRWGAWSIPLASLLAIVSPLCTFAVIPLVAGLLAVGLPAPPLVAFLVASPLMNPTLFAMTMGAMGIEMALARTISALVLGTSAGLIIQMLVSHQGRLTYLCPVTDPSTSDGKGYSCGKEMSRQGLPSQLRRFGHEFTHLGVFVGKYLIFAVVIAAIVEVMVPGRWIVQVLGYRHWYSVVLAVLLGVPFYVCGGGTIPVIMVLLRLGMDKGAALAFFIAGPATKFSTVLTLRTALGNRLLLFYLMLTFGGAVLFGFIFGAIR